MNSWILLSIYVGLIMVTKGLQADGVASFDMESDEDLKLGTTCPNNRTRCNNRQTCCVTKHNSYHCCRYPNAVCCPDKYHCCPEGSTCDSKRHRCVKSMLKLDPTQTGMIDFKKDQKSILVGDITCPNNKTKCKDTKTCCITKHNNYYCCPHKNAVCCSDKYQCCPEGTKCDLKNKKCISSSSIFKDNVIADVKPQKNQLVKILKASTRVQTMNCPDNVTQCFTFQTCCLIDENSYGCCPFENAICCADKNSCCRHNEKCDLKNNICVPNLVNGRKFLESSNSVRKLEMKKIPLTKGEINLSLLFSVGIKSKDDCPDGESCPGDQTCCPMSNDKYGCCPYRQATCCPDLTTCCPHGTQCTGSSGCA